jgi:ubiquitin carboxyl-terminal hydrolase 4/11
MDSIGIYLTSVDSSVSEQKDTSRIVSSGAYLLFYRRRSDVPLGGHRFKEIVDRYNNPPESSEEDTESGEDQRLAVDSSFRGSASASIGVGAARLPAAGSAGAAMTRPVNLLTSGGVALQSQTTINLADLENEKLPPYQKNLDDDDAAPLIVDDAVMNEGIDMRGSMEDEGIEVNMGYDPYPSNQNVGARLPVPSWSFSNLPYLDDTLSTDVHASGVNSDIDDNRSDIVQNDSSASEGEFSRRKDEFDNADLDDEYRSPTPIPEVSEQDQLAIMDIMDPHGGLMGRAKRNGGYNEMDMGVELNVRPELSDDEVEPDAAEIHVREGEGLN